MQIGRVYKIPVVAESVIDFPTDATIAVTVNHITLTLVTVGEDFMKMTKKFNFKVDDVHIALEISDEFLATSYNPEEGVAHWLCKKYFFETGKTLPYESVVEIMGSNPPLLMVKDSFQKGGDFALKAYASEFSSEFDYLAESSKDLPGVQQVVRYPCNCYESDVKVSIRRVIIHLNDRDEWTREEIADWLDELADAGEINIDFDIDSGIGDDLEMEIKNAAGN